MKRAPDTETVSSGEEEELPSELEEESMEGLEEEESAQDDAVSGEEEEGSAEELEEEDSLAGAQPADGWEEVQEEVDDANRTHILLSLGSYEGGLIAYDCDRQEQIVGYAPHQGSVRCLASSGEFLVSGASDDKAKVFNLFTREELGVLDAHDSLVTCAAVFGRSRAITGGADGKLCIWRMSDLQLLGKPIKTKTGVSAISIHPTGKLLLSAHHSYAGVDEGAEDGSNRARLHMWDLTTASSAWNMDLTMRVERLAWNLSGSHFLMLPEDGRCLQIVEPATGKIASVTRGLADRVTAAEFVSDDLLLVGDAKGALALLSLRRMRRFAAKERDGYSSAYEAESAAARETALTLGEGDQASGGQK